ncbi:SdrD B-like domain-containing protein [Amycolatopsis sp. NPDC001319]|uniref:SdrD B-like domain-containing protein n=1 Tax=unclassified Amycolatopsis TaxID=2618356 RepID=UPI003693A1D2
MSRRSPRGVFRLLAGLTAALTLGALVTPAASADPAKLVITASVDSGVHLVGKPFPITVTVHNASAETLTAISLYTDQNSGSYVSTDGWGDFGYPGATLAPDETRTLALNATVYSWGGGSPEFDITSTSIPSWDVQPAHLSVPFVDPTTTTGTLHGVVYGDANGNNAFDPGEGLAGAPVRIYGDQTLDTVTGADGSFTFADLPARYYQLFSTTLPDGWLFAEANGGFGVTGGDQNVEVRAVRPLSDQFHATATLDRGTYAPGDQAQVTITLTNTGSQALSGISGWCDRLGGSQQELQGWQSWTDLVYPASLTFAPGETRTFTETGTVPAVANQYGGFGVACDFGPETGGPDGYPSFDLWARVPGATATSSGWIYHDDNKNFTQDPGEAIADTDVSLVDVISGSTTATGTTDADGYVTFTSVPAGRYELKADGWVPADAGSFQVQAGTCQSCGWEWSQVYTRS